MKFVGLSLALFVTLFSNAYALPAKFAVSPDNSQELLLSTIRSAKKHLVINIYMITSFRLQQALSERLNNDVKIEMLVEGEPYGRKIVSVEKDVLDRLDVDFKRKPETQSKLFLMTSQRDKVKRRYVFNHAKYVVVDGERSYISSENFVGSGTMTDPLRKGNRGWQTVVDSKVLAQQLLRYFAEDTNTKNPDVVPYDPSLVDVLPPLPAANSGFAADERTIPPVALGSGNVEKASLCASPRSLTCMTDFMKAANKSLDVQHLSLPLYWPDFTKPERDAKILNPLVAEIIAAARRKAKVRVLVAPAFENEIATSDTEVDSDKKIVPPTDPREVVEYLNALSKKENLSLKAAILNTQKVQVKTVHNKGMIADGAAVFVGSINGTENSVSNNREMGISLQSKDAADYYSRVYDFDWEQSKTADLE